MGPVADSSAAVSAPMAASGMLPVDVALDAGGAVVLLLAVVALLLGVLAGRRWLLQRRWATFECSLRESSRSYGRGWALGVGAYADGVLRWYRLFSLRTRPLLVLDRRTLEIRGRRQPVGVETRSLLSGHTVLAVRDCDRSIELAMRPEAVTSFTAWLETASRVEAVTGSGWPPAPTGDPASRPLR